MLRIRQGIYHAACINSDLCKAELGWTFFGFGFGCVVDYCAITWWVDRGHGKPAAVHT
jgi:hypothetical protein